MGKITSIETLSQHYLLKKRKKEKRKDLALLKDDLTFVLNEGTQTSLVSPAERTFVAECLSPASMH